MADAYIQSLTDLWNDAGTDYNAIKMNVTNSASGAGSRLLTLQVGGSDKFYVDKSGNVVAAGTLTSVGAFLPSANDGGALGASGTAWSDLFLAPGGVINWNAGDVTATHSANALAFAGASSGYSFDASLLLASGSTLNFNSGDVTITHSANALAFAGATTNGYSFADGPIKPATNDGASLGVSGTAWSDLFLASGAVLNFAAGDVVATHSTGILTFGTGDLRVTTAGTNTASVVTVGGTQTLTGKTFTSPTINGPAFGGAVPTGLDASTTAKGISEFATAAEYRTGTDATRSLVVSEVWASGAEVTLTDAATIAVDMSTFINAVVTLGGNRALGNPSLEKVCQTGHIRIVQDATGSRTLSYGTDWEFAGGVAPVLSTAANAQDLLFYRVIATDRIFASLVKAIA